MSDLEENKEASSLITLQLDIGEREFQSLDEMQGGKSVQKTS